MILLKAKNTDKTLRIRCYVKENIDTHVLIACKRTIKKIDSILGKTIKDDKGRIYLEKGAYKHTFYVLQN